MYVLNRYILKEFIRLFLLVLGIFVFIYLLVDFFEKIDNFLEVNLPASAMLTYFVYKIPLIITQMEPVAILMAGVLTISLLIRGNEMLAMKSIGRNLLQTTKPIFWAAFLLSVLLFQIKEGVVPLTMVKTNFIWDVQVKKKQPKGLLGKDKFWFKGENAIYSIGHFSPDRKLLQDIEIFVFDQDFYPKKIIYARAAKWTNHSWLFKEGRLKTLESDRSYKIIPFDEQLINLAERPADFREMTQKADEMSFEELSVYIQKLKHQGQDTTPYRVDLQARLAYPALGPILLLLGIPALLWRRLKSSIALGISLGMFLVFVVWITWNFSLTMGKAGLLPPFVAAWFPLMLFGALGASGWRAVWQ
ncbi:MAG: LPS export ABC transporter permease LptG [Thermodesulfobacteriota bacterium]|nr:LPS export ABC transporter permease LptG [Thermodesulfobacteriota bacterium]